MEHSQEAQVCLWWLDMRFIKSLLTSALYSPLKESFPTHLHFSEGVKWVLLRCLELMLTNQSVFILPPFYTFFYLYIFFYPGFTIFAETFGSPKVGNTWTHAHTRTHTHTQTVKYKQNNLNLLSACLSFTYLRGWHCASIM